jgi:hypothetical protein
LSKYGTGCFGGTYHRFFTVDDKNFAYYENKQSTQVKKMLKMKNAKAEFQEFEQFKIDAKKSENAHYND